MAALAQEVARSTPELKAAFEQGLQEILPAIGGERKEAIFCAGAMIGGVVLARAVQDPRFSEEILMSVRQRPRLILPSRSANGALVICQQFRGGHAPTAEMAVTPPSIRKSAPTTYTESFDAR